MILWTAIAALQAGPGGDRLPNALLRAIESREAIETARIEYSVQWTVDGVDPRTQFYSWQAAGPDFIQIQRGDEDGVFQRGPDGNPADPHLNRPDRWIARNGEVWKRWAENTAVDLAYFSDVKNYNVRDLRLIGLGPTLALDDPRHLNATLAASGLPPAEFTSRREGELEVVTATWQPGEALIWYIDPRRDWNVVRSEVYQQGKRIGEQKIELAQDVDSSIWFPTSMEQFGFDGKLRSATRVHAAEFNRPEHAAQLSPEDVGIEPGMFIFRRSDPKPVGVWDGKQVISESDFEARYIAGTLRPGPALVRESARLAAQNERARNTSQPAFADEARGARGTIAVLRIGTEWEQYTRRFIDHYELDREQIDRAWTICRRAQERAEPIVVRLGRQLTEFATSQPGDAAGRAAESGARARALAGQIDELFESQLRRRLEQLLTRAQVDARPGRPDPPPTAEGLLRDGDNGR